MAEHVRWYRRLGPDRPAERRLVLSTLVNMFGSGAYLPVSALYFTKVGGLGLGQVAAGLTIAGSVALLAAVPLGGLADRVGARRVYRFLLLAQTGTMAAMLLVRTFPLFVLVVMLNTVADRGATAARGALVGDLVAGPAGPGWPRTCA